MTVPAAPSVRPIPSPSLTRPTLSIERQAADRVGLVKLGVGIGLTEGNPIASRPWYDDQLKLGAVVNLYLLSHADAEQCFICRMAS